MSPAAARALWIASGLLVARSVLVFDAREPLPARSAPRAGAARLLYGERLDLNREPAATLELLPGLGASRAAAIVAGRPYCALEDLDRVPGVGTATLAALRAFAAFPAPPPDCERQLHEEKH